MTHRPARWRSASLGERRRAAQPVRQERVDDSPAAGVWLDEAAPYEPGHCPFGAHPRAEPVALREVDARQALTGVVGQEIKRLALGGLRLLPVGERLLDRGEVGLLVLEQILVGGLYIVDRDLRTAPPGGPGKLLGALGVRAGDREQVGDR